MRLFSVLLVSMVAFLAACAGPGPKTPAASASGASQDQTSPDSASVAPDDPDAPHPPPGAQVSLLCRTFSGPSHELESRLAKADLMKTSGMPDWYLIHGAKQSYLFYGYYATYDDRSQVDEYTRAHAAQARLASMTDADGQRVFDQVIFLPLEVPDPPAPKEWEISQNPGYWTVEVAVYRDSPLRKQYAVDAVRTARAQGQPWFYHHGLVTSEVYVGSWPRDAVAEQEEASAQTEDHTQPLLVLSQPPPDADTTQFLTNDGRKMKVVYPKLDIRDPGLKQTIAQWPSLIINGEVRGQRTTDASGHTTVVPYPSVLMHIPHANQAQAAGDEPNKSAQTPPDAAPPSVAPPSAAPTDAAPTDSVPPSQ